MSGPLPQPTSDGATSDTWRNRLTKALRIEWLGQMAASLFWIASVLTYGISAAGDWLQLLAACSWLVANIASLVTTETQARSPQRR